MNELSPSTTTISVFVRHGTTCKREHPGLPQDYKNCNCRKSIYIYEHGEDHPIAAKTRIWNEAGKIAQAERDKRDPDKQKVKELEARLAAVQAQAEATAAKKTLTIEEATERWLKAQKGVEINTACTHRWVVSRVRAWTKGKQVIPLSPTQFEELLAAIPICCAADNGILHGFAAELRALCLLQVWSGLRIGDAVALPRVGLVGNLLTLITQKTGVEIKDRVIPDLVAAELASLSEDRKGFKKEFFFWPKSISNMRSLESIWEQYFGELNRFLNFKNQLGDRRRSGTCREAST